MLPKIDDLTFFARSSENGAKSMLWATKDKPTEIHIKYKCVCGYIGETILPKQDIMIWKCEKCGKQMQFMTYKAEKKLKSKK